MGYLSIAAFADILKIFYLQAIHEVVELILLSMRGAGCVGFCYGLGLDGLGPCGRLISLKDLEFWYHGV